VTQRIKPTGTDMPPVTPTPVHDPIESGQPAVASGVIPAEWLFKGAQEIRILHKSDLYHLRITRNDKLILTK
jgi:hemin uptake protein HemP